MTPEEAARVRALEKLVAAQQSVIDGLRAGRGVRRQAVRRVEKLRAAVVAATPTEEEA